MNSKKGMSLTEVMITIGILAIVAIPLYFVLEDTTSKTNLAMAKDYIKQEANKVLALLENDLTQARKGSYKEENGKYTIQVRENEKSDMDLEYTFERPVLRRSLGSKTKKHWIVSKVVDNLEITKALDGTPGKMVINLVMKANLPGIKDSEQPTYEQQKIIVMMEDATEQNDPFWREVGDVSKFFTMRGDLMAGIKEDASQLIQDFSKTWAEALGDITKMSLGELQKVASDLKKNLSDLKKNLNDINRDILDLDWHALYDEAGLGTQIITFGQANKKRRKKANRVKEMVAGYKTKAEMNWESVKSAGSGMKEEAIKAMYDAKVQLFDGQAELEKNLKNVEDQIKTMQ